MTQTLRDLQADYIDKLMSTRLACDVYSETFIVAYEYLKGEIFEVAKDITERIRDDHEEGFIEAWRDKAYDHIIKTIDWDSLNQCETCHKFSEDYRMYRNHKFCSEGCLHTYFEQSTDTQRE